MKISLPSTIAKGGDGKSQGWKVETVVKQSLIPGAGVGRFATENVTKEAILCVKKGTCDVSEASEPTSP